MTPRQRHSAFTLVELVMVIVIVGLLAAVITPQLTDLRGDAQYASERATVSAVRTGIKVVRLSNVTRGDGDFPSVLDNANKGAAADDNPLFADVVEAGVTDERWEKLGQRRYRYVPTGNVYKYDEQTGKFTCGAIDGGPGLDGDTGPGLVFSDSLTAGRNDAWNVTRGEWGWTESGMANAKRGENRAFLDALDGMTDYRVDLTAKIDQGKGWGLWFGANLDNKNRVSGYNFQYDPGWNGGSYLLRKWENDRESVVLPIAMETDYGTFHDFSFDVSGGTFNAYQDGELIMSYEGDLDPQGDLLGLRTWSNTEVTFQDFKLTELPGGGE